MNKERVSGIILFVLILSLVVTNLSVQVFAGNDEAKADLAFLWIGDTVAFGSYEQDNNTANGPEPLEWLVLDIQEGRVLLLSRYAVDCRSFTETVDSNWSNSSTREWLNSSFFETAFSSAEQEKIIETERTTLTDGIYGEIEDSEERTTERVFLLSNKEFWNYYRYPGMNNGRCQITEYAIAQGILFEKDGTCEWWLRNPTNWNEENTVICINMEGYEDAKKVSEAQIGVRPAIWVKLDSAVLDYLTPTIMIHCPECGELIKAESFSCQYCGKPLSELMNLLAVQQIEKVEKAFDTYYFEEKYLTPDEFRTLLSNFTDCVIPIEKYYTETAALIIDNRNISPAELSFYYEEAYESFIDEWDNILDVIELETSGGIQSLSDQKCFVEEFATWRDYFIDVAIEDKKLYTVFLTYAEQHDITLSEEEIEDIETYCSEELVIMAEEEGYSSVAKMISEICGAGNTAATLQHYLIEAMLAEKAYDSLRKDISQKIMEKDISSEEVDDLIEKEMSEWIELNMADLAVEYCPFFKIACHFPTT